MDFNTNLKEILEYCQNYKEPVSATGNGQGRFIVMTEDTYEEITGRNELYRLIQDGIDDFENGRTLTEEQVRQNMKAALGI